MIGTRLGQYEVQALVGGGGMADVYRGFDHNLGRVVAIKIMVTSMRTQAGLNERFRQEARIIANLHHPHIVRVYDLGSHDGLPYMVQEWLPGPTLEQRLKQTIQSGQPMPLAEALEITRQLASALDAAHAAGVVHRDVKPANVLWNALGALVLADFGIARDTLAAAHHTQTGTVIGTPLYLSPEQAQAQKVTAASDIYSLGVVLFELLTGRVPFTGDTAMSIAIQHIQAPPPALTALRADLSPAVEAVVLRALDKDPVARYKQARLLVQALEQALRNGTPNAVFGGVHVAPTTIWTPSAPVDSSSVSLPPAQPPTSASVAPPTQAPPPAPQSTSQLVTTSAAANRYALVLALVALCIGIVLIAGLVALRRSPSLSAAAGGSPTQPAAVATAPVTSSPTSAPTSAPSATAEPATPVPPSPTPVPPSPTPVPPSPTPVPPSPTPDNPLVSLRTLLVAGVADGSIRRGGDALIKQVDAVTQQLRNQNAQRARRELRNLQNELNKRKQNGDATAEFADAALKLVDAVAATYQINLQGGDDDD